MPFGLRSISWSTWYQSSGGSCARFRSSSTLSSSVRSMRTRLAHASTTAGLSLAFIVPTLEQHRLGLNHHCEIHSAAPSTGQLTSCVRSDHLAAKNRLHLHG